ncbi:MAG: hypothetical protein Q8K70_01885 [Bacteroidota bacterium]|nr:hypothetical protein [Bacteroidota bacterium]
MKFFLSVLLLICILFSCKKEPVKQTDNPNIEVGAFQFMPMFFGSKWTYKIYDMKPTKTLKGMEYYKYDSVPDVIYIFNTIYQQTGYASWYKSKTDINTFYSGNNRVLFNTNFIDSTKGKQFVLGKDNNSAQYIYGGLDTLETKFGKIPCIVTSGESFKSSKYIWKRHFGKGYGVMKYESFTIQNRDTFYHTVDELDSYFINRP